MVDFSALFNDDVMTIINVIEDEGYEARVVGGPVRDSILGLEPKDIDLGTTALPKDVVRMFTDRGLTVVETGIKHGTVTVVINKIPYEVTTLRVDTAADGRHASVEYVTDWKLDALRRDLTINAMSVDKDGNLYDYFGGRKDLDNRIVRFVGDPRERIEEDYLRVLRFVRFAARLQALDNTGRIEDYMDGESAREVVHVGIANMELLSKERIWDEIKKMSSRSSFGQAMSFLESILQETLGVFGFETDVPNLERLTPLGKVAMWATKENIHQLCNVLKVSGNERTFMCNVATAPRDGFESSIMARRFRYGDVVTADLMRLEGFTKEDVFAMTESPAPVFPLSGKFLMAKGIAPGVQMGRMLKAGEDLWLKSGGNMNAEELFSQIS